MDCSPSLKLFLTLYIGMVTPTSTRVLPSSCLLISSRPISIIRSLGLIWMVIGEVEEGRRCWWLHGVNDSASLLQREHRFDAALRQWSDRPFWEDRGHSVGRVVLDMRVRQVVACFKGQTRCQRRAESQAGKASSVVHILVNSPTGLEDWYEFHTVPT